VRIRGTGLAPALPAVLLLAIVFVSPTAYVLAKNLGAGGGATYAKFFSDEFYRAVLADTVVLALRVTLIALLIGYPTAYFVARTASRFKNVLMILTVFPFLVSAIVRAYGWQVILGDTGLLNQLFSSAGLAAKPVKILYTMTGVTIGMVHLLLPYMILSIAGVVQAIPDNLESAAASLGAGRVAVWRRIILPLSLPGVVTGCVLVFAVSMTAFVTPRLLGGARVKLMSTMVYQEVAVNFNWPMASTISFILLGAILLFLLVANLATARAMERLGGGKRA
jgi:putative spermidine/putrescine transport system permease protein